MKTTTYFSRFLAFGPSSLLVFGACAAVLAQAPAVTSSSYDATTTAQKFVALRDTRLKGTQSDELKQACEQAATHQDVNALVMASSVDDVNIKGLAIDKIGVLPVALQKQAMVRVLRDDRFWQIDPVRGETSTSQMSIQSLARSLASALLHRDLRQTSRVYDPDEKKQARAEGLSFTPMILDPAAREQAAQDLLAH